MNEQMANVAYYDPNPEVSFIARRIEELKELRIRDIPAMAMVISGGYDVAKNVFGKEGNLIEVSKGGLKILGAFVIGSTGKH